MIYNVYWLEHTAPQSVFFYSLSHAKFFVQRLKQKSHCRQIFLVENEVLAA